ncbi:MAG: hypothetical protein A3I11_07675 [Elusimicrobia bacterium RIFCSPLOWO2_02_FULL_39_32]|nr:MAG: hypothetical protein A2034_05215 [Elusimicrobia bacterium GWA2_38_7]OGR79739.1 MAG: hypothetical protein A3B80_01025 [Elusimicrobia bacterium RIFCSPHIGHO2_02_FULL_39_36]OGR92064.1 MAG: hypothetical protein A3I11_07675 [Elusimicrobia bacterium RIFCSPLOWO2_02_FULL_39_32]OGR98646.1 MAG: hypothetical protein A3G85_04755 [Elusimicrobia bacterium RIFCSPLOWO2_12_FULL_39_28]
MKMKFKNKQKKLLRLLTLAAFFHFSGLNNGFTQILVVSGQIQQTNFAPFLITHFLQAMNPIHLKKQGSLKQLKKVLFGSGKTIQTLSQSAVQRILTEGNLLQIWMAESFKQKFIVSGSSIQKKRGSVESSSLPNTILEGSSAQIEDLHSRTMHVNYLKDWVWEKSFGQKHLIRKEDAGGGGGVGTSCQDFVYNEVFNLKKENLNYLRVHPNGFKSQKFEGERYLRSSYSEEALNNLEYRSDPKKIIPKSHVRDDFFIGAPNRAYLFGSEIESVAHSWRR